MWTFLKTGASQNLEMNDLLGGCDPPLTFCSWPAPRMLLTRWGNGLAGTRCKWSGKATKAKLAVKNKWHYVFRFLTYSFPWTAVSSLPLSSSSSHSPQSFWRQKRQTLFVLEFLLQEQLTANNIILSLSWNSLIIFGKRKDQWKDRHLHNDGIP